MRQITALLFVCLVLSGCGKDDASDGHHAGDATGQHDELSSVTFETSCSDAVADDFNQAVALLHNMTYNGARTRFKEIAEADPGCGMAHWGVGMSYIHPLWSDSPNDESMADGLDRVAKARATNLSDYEKGYVDALAAYYENAEEPLYDRLKLMAEGMAEVHEQYPDDLEAKAFFALTHLSTMEPGTVDTELIERAADAALEVMAKSPDHPGAHHYVIHAFDYPQFAERALEVAERYAKLAPANPHALHMPTHIFTRLGMWDASIALNIRSSEAALEAPFGDAVSVAYPHALDYLLYAYIQTGQDAKAKEIHAKIKALKMPIQVHPGSAYHLASADARMTLEYGDWAAAAAIGSRQPSDYPWDGIPQFEALSHFAIAIGGARSGNATAARGAVEALEAIEEKVSHPYWNNQVKVMRLASQAWIAEAEGDRDTSSRLMHEAAALEETMSKHPTTPGEVLPAADLLGDMMLLHGKPSVALAAYKASLLRAPNRFMSLYGAAQAAAAAGEEQESLDFYRQLLEVCDEADSERTELATARAAVGMV